MIERITLVSKKPKNCSETEIDTFVRMVIAGGEVVAKGLLRRVMRAESLIFLYGDECVGVVAIKNPSSSYKDRVFGKANVIENNSCEHELGWLYITETARGNKYANAMMEAAKTELGTKSCFATARENNEPMHYLLNKYGFLQQGQPYKSNKGDYSVVLYVAS